MAVPQYGTPQPITEAAIPQGIAATAQDLTLDTQLFVKDQVTSAVGIANYAIDNVFGIIDGITPLTLDLPPLPESIDPEFDITIDQDSIDPIILHSFGSVTTPTIGNAPTTAGVGSVTSPTIPTFTPSIDSIVIPDAPPNINIPEPGDAPPAPILVFPDDLTITLPDDPPLVDVIVPDFAGLILPIFDPTYPEFTESPINAVLDWVEPTYTREIISDVLTQLEVFMAGGSGINAVVEDAIMARGRDREDRLVRQQEQQATGEWANKGYTAPPGMLVQRIDDIREEGTLKKLGLQRDIVIKVYDTEIENLRFAVQQGIVAEQVFVQLFLASTERLFEAQRLTVQWQIELYNIAVTVFNAKMQEIQIRASVYEVQIRAELAEIEIFKAEVDAELAKAQVNTAKVESYKAAIEARKALVDMYSAQVNAVAVRSEAYGTEIQAYRGTIEAYATKVDADKTRFDAYESRIKGEVGKASVIEAEARAYQAEISGIATGVTADVETLRGNIAVIDADIRSYEANVRGQLGKSQVQLGQVQTNVQGFAADVGRFTAEVGREESSNNVEVAAWEASLRNTIEFFKAQVGQYGVSAETIIKQADFILEKLTTQGQLASTVAAGSMSAMHVGATMNGGSSVGANGSESRGVTLGLQKSCSVTDTNTNSFASSGPVGQLTGCPVDTVTP